MQVRTGGGDVHHHGLLAGLGAGAAGVLALLVLALAEWHQVSAAIGPAATVVLWALVALVLARVAFEIAVRFLRLRHHIAHPETLVRQSVRAEVIPAGSAPAITGTPVVLPAARPAAALPPGRDVILPADPEDAIAMIRAIAAGRENRR